MGFWGLFYASTFWTEKSVHATRYGIHEMGSCCIDIYMSIKVGKFILEISTELVSPFLSDDA